MLSDPQIALVCSGRHGDPFSVLGIHPWQGREWLRAMLPGASQVVALEAGSGELLAVLEARHPDGLFEAALPAGGSADYRLQIRWADGSSTIADDPYRFGPVLEEAELERHAQGLLVRPSETLGAVARVVDRVGGTAFAVWAPNASRVSLVGDFNHWDGRRHGMRLRQGYGVWEIFLPGVGAGAHYKYEIRSHAGRVLPAKSDPYALQCEAPPGTNSVTAQLPPVMPAPAARAGAAQTGSADAPPMAIYEVHLGSWRRPAAPGRGRTQTWDELADTLAPYAGSLGFTHLELLPIGEHPFDGSWGYQQTGPYAPTARFGEAAGFGRFVARCHAHGLKVIIDWVADHFPGDPHGLARFDGSRLYEGAEVESDSAPDWNALAFDAARPQVRNYLVANALFWIERYGVDGLRVADAAGIDSAVARALIDEVRHQIARLRPQALIIGSQPGLDLRWDRDWTDGVLRCMAREPDKRAAHMGDISSHALRAACAVLAPVVLALAHDRVLPEQGSLLAQLPGSRGKRFAQLRALYGFMYAHPGHKLLFMGNEFAHAREWQHEQGLDWSLLDDPAHQGVQRLVSALNRLLQGTPALHDRAADQAAFEWIEPGDGRTAMLCFQRRDDAASLLIAVCNFADVAQPAYRVGAARPGRYVECLNTDAAEFGGASLGAGASHDAVPTSAHARAHSIVLDVPASTTVLLAWQA